MNRSTYLVCITPRDAATSERLRAFLGRLQPSLTTLVDAPGVIILGDANAASLTLPGGRGLIWGHLFEQVTFARVTDGVRPALLQPADELLRSHWGGYVAIRSFGDAVEVLRDPSGAVACYHAEIDGAHVVTSRPDLLLEHGLLLPAIDWTIVAQSLCYRDLRPARTALRGIDEVLPGMMLELRAGRAQSRCAWSPWTFAEPGPQSSDPATAAATLRACAMGSIGAWVDCFEAPIIEISGGLDSSLVTAGAAAVSTAASCITFGPAEGDPDERPWARAVAARTGLPLQELTPDASIVDIARTDSADLPRPCARALSQAFDAPLQALGRLQGADAFLGGGGGDSIFCLLHSALPVVDRWLEAPPHIAPGKRRHVWSIIAIQNHLEGYGREAIAPLVAPLMSQPILETCLTIPTWLWCSGGNNRAVAREAFRDLLPAAVIDRRTKVAFNGLVHRVIRASLPTLREILLGGVLARQGLIDTQTLEAHLKTVTTNDEKLPELMALVEVEAWSRHWESLSYTSPSFPGRSCSYSATSAQAATAPVKMLSNRVAGGGCEMPGSRRRSRRSSNRSELIALASSIAWKRPSRLARSGAKARRSSIASARAAW
ncbi:asparagine synthase C-terminal domain-containing protein [Sphingomonas sp. LB-2]|uniref:asparagine synthase C-terminal domain-containing protein n=1 Tax=Sphingomonas caeni TaxID=2984949 RepID=UPI0022304CF0|nr:asparagine synthase C-terminal domain-containing protein [Sphingomonas caeni]MCW3847917.1 asparagine synthase C-terminal domain-containing protein [Sphingomonas caeni]